MVVPDTTSRGHANHSVVPNMNRSACICCIVCILPLVTHCEKYSAEYKGKTMHATDSDYTLVMATFDKTNEEIRANPSAFK